MAPAGWGRPAEFHEIDQNKPSTILSSIVHRSHTMANLRSGAEMYVLRLYVCDVQSHWNASHRFGIERAGLRTDCQRSPRRPCLGAVQLWCKATNCPDPGNRLGS